MGSTRSQSQLFSTTFYADSSLGAHQGRSNDEKGERNECQSAML